MILRLDRLRYSDVISVKGISNGGLWLFNLFIALVTKISILLIQQAFSTEGTVKNLVRDV